MLIGVAIQSLAGLGGTETYVVTVADHLQRLGHRVFVLSRDHGPAREQLRALGIPVVESFSSLGRSPDAIVANDAPSSAEAAAIFPNTPQIYVAHSPIFDVQHPLDGISQTIALVTMSSVVRRRIEASPLGQRLPIVQLRQPVDLERFRPHRPLPARPGVALSLSNYAGRSRLQLLERACRSLGIHFVSAGLRQGELRADTVRLLNKADIVFAVGRTAVEAMACGRAVYVIAEEGAEGWVSDASYERLIAGNLSAREDPHLPTLSSLAEDLGAYTPDLGRQGRELALRHHDAFNHVASLIEITRRYGDGTPPQHVDGAVTALMEDVARLVRLMWRHESEAFRVRRALDDAQSALNQARQENNALRRRAEELERQIAQLKAESERTMRELEAARTHAERAAASLRHELDAVYGSVRWRWSSALLWPIDRLRSRSG